MKPLHTRTISITHEEDIAARLGDGFQVTTGNSPISGATGVILYLKNTSLDKLMIVENLQISFATAGAHLSIQFNDTGTPATTTALTQVNTNLISNNTAEADAFTTSGTAVSGLTDGSIALGLGDLPGDEELDFHFDGTYILGKDNVFTVDVDSDGAGTAQTGDTSFAVRYRFEETLVATSD